MVGPKIKFTEKALTRYKASRFETSDKLIRSIISRTACMLTRAAVEEGLRGARSACWKFILAVRLHPTPHANHRPKAFFILRKARSHLAGCDENITLHFGRDLLDIVPVQRYRRFVPID